MGSKGARTERELMDIFAGKGYGVVRAAGSGKSRHPGPDILVGNQSHTLAIECKASKGSTVYIEKGQIDNLHDFAARFGARPLVAFRFNNEPWYFLDTKRLEWTGTHHKATLDLVKERGFLHSDLA